MGPSCSLSLSTSAHTATSVPPSSSSSTFSARSSPSSKTKLAHFLKWNSLLTFGFCLLYAAVLTTSSSLIQNNIKPLPTTTRNEEPNSQLSTHST
ncbi:hypothetical protein PGT21_012511 [Puccinia graminis f. sp. tritici]|uniref:Uncharacterized protein n=1 Tax=Puccinia graminis f. sp. tritici TaxID=56615 RepID=A0A5B0N5D7_PUCGR|nr:hypothetical protein PGTUg99_014573 [Puccinia graminis f. sp. tritici]KAA1083952.1 hypothetical protein PGT21_012511 [Puccinia graminis f. sp. tritici]